MGLIKNFMNQTRKPEGVLGKLMVIGMNPGHAKLADWGMSHIATSEPAEIVDIGCGGGRNAGELLKRYSNAKVTAVDYSPLCVAQAKAHNKEAIKAGRCIVQQGDVSALALEHNGYDLATAFETIYFWPGLEQCFEQVAGILKSGGQFLIVNEADGIDEATNRYESIVDGMKIYTAEEIETALKTAGFVTVAIRHHKNKPWITVIAEK